MMADAKFHQSVYVIWAHGGQQIVTLNSSHASLVSRPNEVTALIDEAAATVMA
jgi:hypothetical protein